MLVKANLVTSNNELESRMREIRPSGSEGRETELNRSSLPLSQTWRPLMSLRSNDDIRPHLLDQPTRNRQRLRWLVVREATTDRRHLASGDARLLQAKVEGVSGALGAQSLDADHNVEYILELDRTSVVTSCANSRPTDIASFVFGDHAGAEVPQEGVFGLFHILKVGREVRDASRIGLAEFDASCVVELVGH